MKTNLFFFLILSFFSFSLISCDETTDLSEPTTNVIINSEADLIEFIGGFMGQYDTAEIPQPGVETKAISYIEFPGIDIFNGDEIISVNVSDVWFGNQAAALLGIPVGSYYCEITEYAKVVKYNKYDSQGRSVTYSGVYPCETTGIFPPAVSVGQAGYIRGYLGFTTDLGSQRQFKMHTGAIKVIVPNQGVRDYPGKAENFIFKVKVTTN